MFCRFVLIHIRKITSTFQLTILWLFERFLSVFLRNPDRKDDMGLLGRAYKAIAYHLMSRISLSMRHLFLFSPMFLLLMAGCAQDTRQPPHAENGTLDLTTWDFTQDGGLNLNGQWLFYWQQLIDPPDFLSDLAVSPTGLFTLPGVWNNHEVDGLPLAGNGYATFRLKVLLAPDSAPKAVHILNQSTAYVLWINGKKLATNGLVGESKKNVTPQFLMQDKVFVDDSPVLDIVLQVANFNHRKGGIWNPVRLGLATDIQAGQNRQFMFDFFLFGCLFIMGGYHFCIYMLRKEDPSTLFFAVFTTVMALRVLVSGNYYLTFFFPNMSWEVVYTIELLSVFIATPPLLLFVWALFPKHAITKLVYVLVFLSIIISLAAIMTPAGISGHLVIPNQVLLLIYIAYILIVLIRAFRDGDKDAGLILVGMSILGGAIVMDILNANRILYTIQLAPFGVLFLICSQFFVLSSRFAGAFHRVTKLSDELKEKNIALNRMDKVKDEFLANTSHELMTPLNGIIGLAESVGDEVFGKIPDAVKKNIGLIVASGRRLSRLINDILDISHLKHSDLSLDRKAVDIRSLTETVFTILEPLAQEKKLLLRNRIANGLPYVHGDELRLQQILYNLVGNAIKFTPSGEITLDASQKGTMVEVKVSDTGIGISKEHFETIFNSFEQIQGAPSRYYNGAGLGLAISKHLVELHQGTISLSSSQGEGTCFSFTLPISTEVPSTVSVSSGSKVMSQVHDIVAEKSASRRDRSEHEQEILVVDDDPINLEVLKSQLSSLDGVAVYTTLSGKEALNLVEQSPPDLLLLDIMMPGITGYEVCQLVRQKHSAHTLPIIFLTAKNQVADLTQGFSCGANDYLVKPFVRDELLARVQTQLELKESYETLKENIRLKKEIDQRKVTELDLQMTQHKLSLILDAVDDAIIGVNESMEITFCNRTCENMLGFKVKKLLGLPFNHLLSDETAKSIQEILETLSLQNSDDYEKMYSGTGVARRQGGEALPCKIELASMDIDNEVFYLLIFQKIEEDSDSPESLINHGAAVLFIEELNKNRQRIQSLEKALDASPDPLQAPEVQDGLAKIDNLLLQMEKTISGEDRELDKRKLGVRVMNLAIQAWETSTGKTKVDLARETNSWKVYMSKNGFERTQTLDKYLDSKRFPKNPRWNKVFQTADFVLLNSNSSLDLNSELEALLFELRALK